ncbi:alfa-L-rhamnosidase [Verticillium alfalfae VaMs.102]|uniref:alpha-L-rhamnosidase n=1 Tax=Verticillium alfalfae (strain VaMs.102 / ATCC MYA-4576 / FGSC 10136) TaxID=526221 RepID=C9SVG8_VERA1|nr:alfa-L-rhamnosidase [Verticillium alfalfae VaMs.102]EEY22783.1 alfa-L-rhamnosidase [Verticillium alfalfae VaMs.102]
MAPPTLTAPQFEHHHNGLGVESATPRISWRFETSSSTTSGWIQAGYDIEVTFASAPETPSVFSIRSDQSILVPWPARPLASREQATVRVRVTGKSSHGDVPPDNEPGAWSAASTVEAALLEVDDFKANFVTSAEQIGPHGPLQPIRLRKTFALPETITSGESIEARLYITALGVFNVWVNGKPASDECLAPGWTSYHHRLAYRILDVSSLLHRDQANILVAEVAEGWYAGRLGFGGGERFRYGEELALAAQLEVRSGLAGTSESWTLVTDNSWTAAASAITTSEIYDGEVYDLQNETDGWNEAATPFHGFRNARAEAGPMAIHLPKTSTPWFILTDMKRQGFFEGSNSAVNQLHSNGVWPCAELLCPYHRLSSAGREVGWDGICNIRADANFLYETLGCWGAGLEGRSPAEQLTPEANGIVPLVVPEAMPSNWPREANSQAIWGDVAVLAPQALYQHSADNSLLERQFDSMKAWLDRGVERAPDGLWNPDKFQLADWLDPNAPPDDPAKASTDSVLVANAFLVHVTDTFASLCSALGKDALASEYTEAAAKLRHQFQRRYITPDGNLVSLSQTGVALAVQFGLYPAEDGPRAQAALTLDQLVRKARFHISTGFAGTPVIAHALTSIGRPQLAYRMLLETGCPSWMYPVTQGATTIWERWDSMLPDGRINPGEMTSFNHYALGAVADWLHGSVAGISPLTPGWKTVRVRPVPGGNLTRASASFDGPYGLVSIAWTLERGEAFRMELTVPPSCSAIVTLPSELRGDYRVAEEASRVVNSGVHVFECICNLGAWPPKPLVHPFMMPPEESPIAGE